MGTIAADAAAVVIDDAWRISSFSVGQHQRGAPVHQPTLSA
jgi:hypothetical protein